MNTAGKKEKSWWGFSKKKIVKEIQDGAWGHLFNVHKITVETLHNELRCVERKGVLDDGRSVTFLRIFNLKDVQRLGIDIKGWESAGDPISNSALADRSVLEEYLS